MPVRRLLVLCAVILIVVTVAGLAAAANLRAAAAGYASHKFHRRVTIGALHVQWRNPLVIEADDVRLANADWGSAPDMVRIGHIEAELDAFSLVHGPLKFLSLTIEQPDILLERNVQGIGNWRFSGGPAQPEDPSSVAASRENFPTLLNAHLRDGQFRMRTSSGSWLRIIAHDFTIGTSSEKDPVAIRLAGAYNDVQMVLQVRAQPFSVFHRGTVPLGTDLTITTASDSLTFNGTMRDPLNADGASGKLRITAPSLAELLPIFNVSTPIKLSFLLGGVLQRNGDHWRLQDAAGRLQGNDFTGAIALDEGAQRQPDALGFDLAFTRLAVKPIVDGIGDRRASSDVNHVMIRPDDKPGVTLDANLTARDLSYGSTRVTGAAIHFRLLPGDIMLGPSTFTFAGGAAAVQGRVIAGARGAQLTADAALTDADATQIVRLAGMPGNTLAGKLNAHAALAMTGDTVGSALKASHGGIVLTMRDGRIARSLIEKASVDLHALIGKADGQSPVQCLLGVVKIKDGIGSIRPLRLRAADADMSGGGNINLIDRTLDLVIQSHTTRSNLLALDIPLQFSGPLSHIGIKPFAGDTSSLDRQPIRSISIELPPDLQKMAAANACAR